MKHIAIIMDGNRRWATDKWLPTHKWHRAWADNCINIVTAANTRWLKYITLWGLSTENLEKRSASEVLELVKIMSGAKKYLDEIMENNGKVELIWDIDKLPKVALSALNYLVEKTKNNTGLTMVLALVYGWKNEIIRGIQKFVSEGWDIDTLNEQSFWSYLDTGKYPPADLIVRTGWDIRHSGFLLYQSDYSEYYFTEKKWPEFDEDELDKAIAQFNKSKRNFWK